MTDRSEPYLGRYFTPPPIRKPAKIRVFTLHGHEDFESVNNYHVDKGYLIIYKAALANENSVRLFPVAVFKPDGWVGYAPGEPDAVEPLPIGFRKTPEE